MLIKVCGMKYAENISELIKNEIDFIGFIFYEKSARYINKIPIEIPKTIKKVGVFVNPDLKEIVKIVRENNLQYVQLHGNESIDFCKALKEYKIRIIKAFSIDENFDFKTTCKYQFYSDYFIFDTKGKNYGGNGVKFNWDLLENYTGETPFLLSGGIKSEDLSKIENFKHKMFEGIDINSGFETEPGLKNIPEITSFISKIKI